MARTTARARRGRPLREGERGGGEHEVGRPLPHGVAQDERQLARERLRVAGDEQRRQVPADRHDRGDRADHHVGCAQVGGERREDGRLPREREAHQEQAEVEPQRDQVVAQEAPGRIVGGHGGIGHPRGGRRGRHVGHPAYYLGPPRPALALSRTALHDRPMLLTNARIHTLDARGTEADSLVVRDGRIAFCGPARRDQSGRRRAGARSRRPHRAAGSRGRPRPSHAPGARRASPSTPAASPPRTRWRGAWVRPPRARRAGQWIAGRGWDQNRWPGMGFPTRASLDRAAPRSSGGPHAHRRPRDLGQLGRPARRRASIATRRDPTGRHRRPRRARRAHRPPRGHRPAPRPAVQPPPDEARFDAAVSEAIGECLARGLTGIHEMGADLRALAAYRRLVERGRFPFRNYVAVAGRDEAAWEHYRARGPERMGDGRVEVRALKLMSDGALGSRGAALHHPYCDDPENTGLRPHPARRALPADRGSDGRRLPGVRARHRRPRQHARARHLRARPRRAGGGARASAPRRARADPCRRRHRPLRAAGGDAEHAGHALHLGHAVGGSAAGRRSAYAAPTRGARCSPPACASRAARTFPSRIPIPFTGSTRR